ncbi:hypothetical protein DMC30DRAFT_407392, partial [Rhodotorula diobovata]
PEPSPDAVRTSPQVCTPNARAHLRGGAVVRIRSVHGGPFQLWISLGSARRARPQVLLTSSSSTSKSPAATSWLTRAWATGPWRPARGDLEWALRSMRTRDRASRRRSLALALASLQELDAGPGSCPTMHSTRSSAFAVDCRRATGRSASLSLSVAGPGGHLRQPEGDAIDLSTLVQTAGSEDGREVLSLRGSCSPAPEHGPVERRRGASAVTVSKAGAPAQGRELGSSNLKGDETELPSAQRARAQFSVSVALQKLFSCAFKSAVRGKSSQIRRD